MQTTFCADCQAGSQDHTWITQLVLDLIQEHGLEFEPPLDPEAKSLRHLAYFRG